MQNLDGEYNNLENKSQSLSSKEYLGKLYNIILFKNSQ